MLPEKYKFLETIGTLPKLITAGLPYLGLKELPGKESNPVIIEMAKDIGVSDIYTDDDLSWCALVINYLIHKTGKPMVDPKGDKYNLLRALYLIHYGNPVESGEEQLGDVLGFKRPGGGHVGFYIAQSKTTFHVMGGNQANSFSITEIQKSRLVFARRYYATHAPESAKKYFIDSSGKLSTNEA